MKAVFLSKVSAYRACIKASKELKVSEDVILSSVKVKPVYSKGELLGYYGFYPTGDGVKPLKENQL